MPLPGRRRLAHHLGLRVQDAIFGALAQALPEIIPACGAGLYAPLVFAQPDFEEGGVKVIVLEPMTGGTGAMLRRPTASSASRYDLPTCATIRSRSSRRGPRFSSASTCSVADSGGPGRFRGGCGSVLELEVLIPDCLLIARGQERHRFRPWGLNGGGCGGKAAAFI